MKRIIYLLFFSFAAITLFAQPAPGGVAGSVLWLKANTGASAAAWNDNSASANNFTQATPAAQPALVTNIFNFNPALQFTGGVYQTLGTPVGFPTANADRTILVVANATDNTGFRWIFVYGAPGTPDGTCQVGNNSGGLINAFYASTDDINTANYWNAPGNLNGALASFILNSTAATEVQYNRGLTLNSQAHTANLSAGLSNAQIGGLQNIAEDWIGNIAEVIMFNSALSNAGRNQVESYLALKYGFSLGTTASLLNYTASDGTTVFWTGNATYQNDIFGIGTDNGSALTQTQSNSMNSGNGNGTGQTAKGNLILSTGTALTNKQFLLVGNNAGLLTEHLIASGEAVPNAVGSQRVLRNWKVQNTGAVGTVALSFDTTGLTYTGGAVLSNFRLMIDQDGDGDYSTGTPTFVAPSSSTGNKLNFTGVTLNNNVVFTIITQASATLPALWQAFTVQAQKDKVVLTWKTSNEVNVDHYDIEHSLNGTSFTVINKVTAKNGTGINDYSLSLEKISSGIHYYRLRRVDKDAQYQYSETKTVRIAANKLLVLIKSNPVTGSQLEIGIDAVQTSGALVRIISLEGKTVLQQNTSLITGSNTFKMNISSVPAGTYLLQVKSGDELINSKFIKQ